MLSIAQQKRSIMSLFPRFILSLVVAIVISGIYVSLSRNGAPGFIFDLSAVVAFVLTAAAAVAITFYQSNSTQKSEPRSNQKSAKTKAQRSQSASGQQAGSVKWFNGNKGFGFITCDNGDEIFVHFRSVEKDSARLSPGKRVEFVVVQGKKGKEAEQVRVV